jgi:hypothetical protein
MIFVYIKSNEDRQLGDIIIRNREKMNYLLFSDFSSLVELKLLFMQVFHLKMFI